MKYDAMLKIWVEGHVAFSNGRFKGTTGRAVIWRKGAEDYWGRRTADNTAAQFFYDINAGKEE